MMWSVALAWRIEFDDAALKELAKLDKPMAWRILVLKVGNRREIYR